MTSEKEEKLRARKAAYSKALDKIITDMEIAASKGKLGTYDRLEKALMTMQRKLGPKFTRSLSLSISLSLFQTNLKTCCKSASYRDWETDRKSVV